MELVTIAGICSAPETFIKSIKCNISVRQVSPLTEVRQLGRLHLSWERKSSAQDYSLKMPAWRQNIWPAEHGFYHSISVKTESLITLMYSCVTPSCLSLLFIINSELKVCVVLGFSSEIEEVLNTRGYCYFLQLSAHLWGVQLLKQGSLKLSLS